MEKIKEKRIKNKKVNIMIILVAIIIIVLGIFVLKNPAITGFFIISKETVHSDNLELVVDESKEVTWNLENPGDLKSIKASGSIDGNGSAKVYIEKDGERLLIFDSTKQLFDINVHVLSEYKKIFQGDELLIQIILFNLRGYGSVDVNVKYSIKDPNGNLIAAEEESVFVETQAKFVRKLIIPSDLKPGTYTAFVEVKTPDDVIGTSSDSFEVKAKYEEVYPPLVRYSAWGVAILIALVAIIVFSLLLFKKLKMKKRIAELKRGLPEEEIQKLEKELKALEGGYKSKLISEASYRKNKERIEKELKRLKR